MPGALVPTSLSFRKHLAAIETAGGRLSALAEAAGEESKVPTCPGWDVRALVAHQTMVHRWATAHVTGSDPAALPSQTEIRDSVDDLPGYYAEGLLRLLEALDAAPDDL
ncbi:MAG: maleylpyruvate isomerase N-terminal domain-containing protein, partial [Acidimicrobiia bacterium]|nr:maleylpyruvate isomerase N-terminal domain-containing protein [Acidimicrobiia bacterium]